MFDLPEPDLECQLLSPSWPSPGHGLMVDLRGFAASSQELCTEAGRMACFSSCLTFSFICLLLTSSFYNESVYLLVRIEFA
jgi:hypothetical protein